MTVMRQGPVHASDAVLDEIVYQAIRMRPGLSAAALELDSGVIHAVGPGRQHTDAVAQSLERLHEAGRITFERVPKLHITLYRNLRPAA